MEREKFGSRLGFLLISAGCAIGIGNVWRFPYIVGQNGGGIFVVIYLFFLAIVGIPVLTMEFAIGRGSQKSCVYAYKMLEPKGTKWHWFGPVAFFGNYVLVMFYTVVAGWMLYYFYSFLMGKFTGTEAGLSEQHFNHMISSPGIMLLWMGITVLIGIIVCSMGLQQGVEKITKVMMILLLLIMAFLAIISMTRPGAVEGIKFYLVPDIQKIEQAGLFQVIVAAMNQAFFTCSLGIGNMMIFGSYLSKDRSLTGESISIAVMDTFVAITAGLIIFPACFAYGVNPDSGPSLVFITLPNVFSHMPGGRIWGALFFLFMSFAALSTIIGVFEGIFAGTMDIFGWSRKKTGMINLLIIFIISIPCILGFNIWSGFMPFGQGTNIMDLEDYVISNILLPLGSLISIIFCTSRYGWGYNQYMEEVNAGKGLKLHRGLRWYLGYILPLIVLVLLIRGILRL